ncbi:hypothetical protein BD309DRAFT_131540 [Dichomitus squalens]|nr:hypothetical protein BD309DRAFT_131540 [Dichomitus squalens]
MSKGETAARPERRRHPACKRTVVTAGDLNGRRTSSKTVVVVRKEGKDGMAASYTATGALWRTWLDGLICANLEASTVSRYCSHQKT